MSKLNAFQNNKYNQHYIAQVEQRSNAIDSTIDKENREIYAFSIQDRANYKLGNPSKVKIKENLSVHDLYTFERIDENLRLNFERFFEEYERKLFPATSHLITKINNCNTEIRQELIDIFKLKILNNFRNPYCIEQTLNTFDDLQKYRPSDNVLNEIYQKIENNRNNETRARAEELRVSENDYIQWIKSLFLLLTIDFEDCQNIFDKSIERIFNDSKKIIHVSINSYTGEYEDKYVALSDRSFVLLQNSPTQLVYQFNLSATVLLTYSFTDKNDSLFSDVYEEAHQLGISISPELVEKIIGNRNIIPQIKKNDLNALGKYNQRVIDYSHSKVFCKGDTIYLGD